MIPDHVTLPVEQIRQRLQADRDRLWRVANKCAYGRHFWGHSEDQKCCLDCGKERVS